MAFSLMHIIILVIPEFGVACRRLTPGPGYLEALCEDNVIGLHVYRIAQGLTTSAYLGIICTELDQTRYAKGNRDGRWQFPGT